MAFISAPGLLANERQGRNFTELFSANDWIVTLGNASGLDISAINRDMDTNHWPLISGEQGQLEKRSEIPLQAWFSQGRYVVVYSYQNQIWKVMMGNPFTHNTMANVGIPPRGYYQSEIDQPWELPTAELSDKLSNGKNRRYICRPYCLFNLSKDPQEFRILTKSKYHRVQNSKAVAMINRYRKLARNHQSSSLCDKGWFSFKKDVVTDLYAMSMATSCQAFVPWVSGDIYKSLCSI